jgi:hypothetical protein
MIKSRRMGCVGHVAHMEGVRSAHKIKVGEERHLEYRHECEESTILK